MIQLSRTGVSVTGSEADLKRLQEQFRDNHYVILPRLFEPTLFEEILKRVEAARFVPLDHSGIGLEFCMRDDVTTAMLDFFPSNPIFLRLIERITGLKRVGRFAGRVYRMTSSDGHYDHWHDDFAEGRVVTMSVNLSRQPFRGGALQLKYQGSKAILHEIRNTGFGDALLFRISSKLTHRVQDVEGDAPKTAFAGWFLDVDDFLPNLKNLARRASEADDEGRAEHLSPGSK